MLTQDLINLFREEADDKNIPYLWSDALLCTYGTEGEAEAARRARLIKDATTAAVCAYAVTTSTQKITLDPRIIYVRSVYIASKTLPLERIHQHDINIAFPGWDTTVNLGDVNRFIVDKETGIMWFDSPFPASDTVNLTVIREPLLALSNINTVVNPEIAPRYQIKLVHWMLHRAFGKQDSETNDPDKAKNELEKFEAEFGKRMSAQDERYEQENYGYDDYDGTY